ncbi:MAG: DNA translocase FtsK [Treponema sp.]|jgi:S-DNA-T family DNA segregation ATPase FtsK/SpoIIIE|nr:DNA translocase FtsK [Treponema sp.]
MRILRLTEIFSRITARLRGGKGLKHAFINIQDDGFKFRMAAIAGAAVLGICAVLLTLSLVGAVFGIKVFPAGPGNFFAGSFGVLAFLIPAYLGYAAFILADPRWRPGRIFILNGVIFPFLTLAAGYAIIGDFGARAERSAFLRFTGKTGFGFVIVIVTLLEALILGVVKNALFPEKDSGRGKGGFGVFLLPPPRRKLREVYTEAAAARDRDEGAAGTGAAPESDFGPLDNPPAVQKADGVTAQRPGGNSADDSVERALEAAEAAALAHSEEMRKKAEAASHMPRIPKKKKYHIPVEILNQYPDGEYWIIDQATRDAAVTLRETLEEFNIQAEVTGIKKGPVITMFEILPAPGVKLSRIVNLQDNIALRLAASSVRIVAPIPGKHAVGIEIPNARRNIVSFREIIEGELQREDKRAAIPVVLGKDITGRAQTADLEQMPHVLIAGTTGAGKSVCVNAIILSILYQLPPASCRLILIDPKIVELKLYNDIPHLLTPVITEPKRAFQALQYCIYEMEQRYACLEKMKAKDIHVYNRRIKEQNIAQEHMPYLVIIIDEFADLMATTGKELEATVHRLASMARAVGIHLVLATQRPSVDVITGLIKANIPSRVAFMVASKMDSRIIIDMIGAEKLLGKGDMLYSGAADPFPVRMQGAFVSEEEVEAVVEHVKTLGEPEYIDDEIFFDEEDDGNSPTLFSDGDDPLYDKALEIVMLQGKASASYIQRRLKIGYNRAARLVEEMETKGVVGPAQGSRPREVLRGM